RVLAHPATVLLHHPERGQQRRHLRGIAREQLVELSPPLSLEDRLIGFVRLGRAHRSISPMTMSMLALIAITSESRWPSTIFEIAARFTNDGVRMRQRTGLDVPSDTI